MKKLLCLFIWCASLAGELGAHDLEFLNDLEKAKKQATLEGKKMILFTGRAQFCKDDDPIKYYKEVVLKVHLEMLVLTNESVLVDRFIYEPMNDAKGRMRDAFKKDFLGWYTPLADKYDLRFFGPTITILDASGKKLNGPFTYLGGSFNSSGRDPVPDLKSFLLAREVARKPGH